MGRSPRVEAARQGKWKGDETFSPCLTWHEHTQLPDFHLAPFQRFVGVDPRVHPFPFPAFRRLNLELHRPAVASALVRGLARSFQLQVRIMILFSTARKNSFDQTLMVD